ncbi:hypothetical protein F4775DRAFT_10455 [Biscogniauxia sp. FL1348]|nr:hypothetical protein F4775DRAFT_10455 [Biscogniauxia sp. FL1348]
MSVPPQLIRVKRKATEETPVSYLRVQENKRHRSDVFVYRRQDAQASFTRSTPAEPQKPIVHLSQPSGPAPAPAFQNTTEPNTDASKSVHGNTSVGTSPDITNTVGPTPEPRRFHMSRKDMMLASYPTDPHGASSKKRSAPALFVERKIKKISSRTLEKFHSAANAANAAAAAAAAAIPTPSPTPDMQEMEVDKPEARKFKKPGVAKLTAKPETPKQQAELPKSMTGSWNIDMDKMAAEMDAYTMEQIGLNLQREREEKQKNKTSSSSNLKFKPKPPAKRYAERHPEEAQNSVDKAMVDVDANVSDSDDGEYIIETYIRVPASNIGDQVPPQNVGLLVFDEEPDMEYFYGEGDDSEDEWAEEEEDENAENYYTADYPDEEVASDDEFDLNPYSFRNGNASDLEEYDMDDDNDDHALSDQETSGPFTTHIGRNGLKTNHL